jgi:hypothetical protein
MKIKKITRTRLGAFLLQALMLFFIVSSSWTSVHARSRPLDGHLKVRSLSTDQIIFRDSNPSESLSNTLVKFSVLDCEFAPNSVDVASRAVALSEAFFITHSTFNTFYHHITINAP